MGGIFNLIPDWLIMVTLFIFLVSILGLLIVDVATTLDVVDKSNGKQIEQSVMTRLVLQCFKDGGDVIDEDYLVQSNGKSIRELCGFSVNGLVEMEDVTIGKQWIYGEGKGVRTGIFVRIQSGDDIRLGRLYVTL